MSNIFVDTNVLVYLHDRNSPDKQLQARNVIDSFAEDPNQPVISTQVMQEYYSILVKKLKLPPGVAAHELEIAGEMHVVTVTPTIIFAATKLHQVASLSFWDALIIAAAQSAGCAEIWTEDLPTGQLFGTTKIVNPFLHS